MSKNPFGFVSFGVVVSCILLSGCTPTFSETELAHSIQRICRQEYKIDRVEVKLVGKTIGVYLPLEKLFSTDFEQILSEGKVRDLSSLLQFSPEALDKVEDVLFSTSRVILSTAKPIDFYVLHATDTELTGITLVLVGYVHDIKRVRFWDISRGEYRKRVFHDVKVNYPVVWKRPVIRLFENLGQKTAQEIIDTYFEPGVELESLSPIFYTEVLEAPLKENLRYRILTMKSTAGKPNEALVYVKLVGEYVAKKEYWDHKFILPSGFEGEYIFVLNKYLGEYRISRVIPFFYLAEDGSIRAADFPRQAQLYENLEQWQEEFELKEVFLADFLAGQITRRIQPMLSEDERIENTFSTSRVSFRYEKPKGQEEKGNFVLEGELVLKRVEPISPEEYFRNEDVLYLLNKVLQEFVRVLRGYRFEDYGELRFEFHDGSGLALSRGDLDLYRQKKVKVDQLFGGGVHRL